MKFGLFYFADGFQQRANGLYDLLMKGARFADENGFTAVWTPERHFHSFGGPYANPAITSAAIAATTTRVQVRAGSVVAPLHHPIRIAEEWSMVDNISRGRAGLAFASGWNAADFVLDPAAYGPRSSIVRQALTDVRAMWRGETVTMLDGKNQQQEFSVFPRPVQAEIPVWMTTGGSVETFKTAGTLGTGVLTHLINQEVEQLRERISQYRDALPAPDRGSVVVMLHTLLGADRDEVRERVRTPMKDYLRSSLDLMRQAAGDFADLDPAELEEIVEDLLNDAFDRYFEQGSLFGTVEDGRRMVETLAAAGVDEIACLIDFGLPDDVVLGGLQYLNDLKELCS